MMHRPTRLKITDVNPHLICILCGGYLIDATTMIECLHSYCRACIVAYLRQSRQCPICDTVVHKTRPLLNIRSDKTLQNLVYKLVPNLFKDEMKRRRDFYAKHPQASTSTQSPNAREERGEVCEDSLVIYTEDEYISLSLDYYFAQPRKEKQQKASDEGDANANGKRPNVDTNGLPGDVVEKRYLRCPAAVCISHIKKFIRNKFGLSSAHRIEVVHQHGADEPLRDDYTLMDIAYIYTWRRNGPLPLLFRVFEPFCKRRKGSQSSISSCDSVPAKVATSPRPSPPPLASPLALQDKGKHFQKPRTKAKPPSEINKVQSQPTKSPSEIPGPSGNTVSHDRSTPSQKVVLVTKPEKVCSTDKPNTSSAHRAITQSSPATPSGKTIIIVTSANPASTSSKYVTNASLVDASAVNTFSSVATVAKSPSSSKADLVSSNAKIPSPKVGVLSTPLDMTSSKAGITSSNVAATPSKATPTSSKVDMVVPPVSVTTLSSVPSKVEVPSSKSGLTSSKPDMMSPKLDIIPKHSIASSKTDKTSSKPLMTSSKPDMTSQKKNMTAPKTDIRPPIVFVSAPLKLDETAGEKNTSAPKENTTLTVLKVPVTSATEKRDTQVAKPNTPKVTQSVPQKSKDEIKTDQPPFKMAIVNDDLRPRPQTETTPTKNNTEHQAAADVSISEGVIIERPVLLQT